MKIIAKVNDFQPPGILIFDDKNHKQTDEIKVFFSSRE